ncbi:MAG: class I SAM-dependent methyltransferase [Halieaceae bacterium]
MDCPLCNATETALFHRDQRRDYLRCAACQLVFVPPAYQLKATAERAEYELHENDPADSGYRHFLSRLAEPLLQRLPAGASGLDFGCGPGPALAQMLREAGCTIALYDPFFAADTAVLESRYDFITATEVVEHLHHPGVELSRLWSLLEPGGYLGLMTKLVIDAQAFANWHYKNDPTHVCFFSVATWQWWARHFHAELELIGSDVILLRRER